MKYTKRMGMVMAGLAILLWMAERASGYFSNRLGEAVCGEYYLQPVYGTVGDISCGFNADMYLSSGLIMLFFLGVFLYIKSK